MPVWGAGLPDVASPSTMPSVVDDQGEHQQSRDAGEWPLDEGAMETLSTEECWTLAAEQVGRLGVVRGGYPVITPVNYTVHGRRVVLRTGPGAKYAASRYRRVSFEVDRVDSSTHSGWSVHVLAFGTDLSRDDPSYEDLKNLDVDTWAPGEKRHILVLTPISVSGRRLEDIKRSHR